MRSVMDIESVDDFSRLLSALVEKRTQTSDDVDNLRRALYREGRVGRRRAAEIVHANRRACAKDDRWIEFYLEALTDFFLDYQNNSVALMPESEDRLLSWLGDNSGLIDPAERRLIARVFMKVDKVSARFEAWVFEAIEDNLMYQTVRWNDGQSRSAGVIDTVDLQFIRRLVNVGREGCCRTTSTAGVDFMLNLDRNVKHFADPVGWHRLLVDGLVRQVFGSTMPASDEEPTQDADALAALTEQLEARYAPGEAASLRDEILLARAWRAPAAQDDLLSSLAGRQRA